MHLLLRNPIWTGWRVIDKKRDSSAAGSYASVNGRQADRRKISRAPEDVIRVKVILEPLVSEAYFAQVQRAMNLKQAKHWRSRPYLEHRFIYNGFLTCSVCGKIIHTAFARRDYYACKGRRVDHCCPTGYMSRVTLEGVLDELITTQLTSPGFLRNCINLLQRQSQRIEIATTTRRLTADI